MTYKLKQILLYTLLIILILSGTYVFLYYIIASEISQLRTLPPLFLVIIILYILVQLGKRFLQDEIKWYNYLYYVGLAAVVIPLPLFSLQENWIFVVTRFGSLFLIISPVIEFIELRKAKEIQE